MSVTPEIIIHELRLLSKFQESRCHSLAQQLADRTSERDQAIADRDAIRVERDELTIMMQKITGDRHGAAE